MYTRGIIQYIPTANFGHGRPPFDLPLYTALQIPLHCRPGKNAYLDTGMLRKVVEDEHGKAYYARILSPPSALH